MRKVIVKLYQYEELNDKAKEKARDWFREGGFDYDWWDDVYIDFRQIAEKLGINIKDIFFSGFSSQGDGACFTGTYDYRKDAVNAIKAYAPGDAKLIRIAEELDRLKSEGTFTLTHSGQYYHSGMVEVDPPFECGRKEWEAVRECLRALMDNLYKSLKAEWGYLNSDEAVAESISANAYEFREDGQRAHS